MTDEDMQEHARQVSLEITSSLTPERAYWVVYQLDLNRDSFSAALRAAAAEKVLRVDSTATPNHSD